MKFCLHPQLKKDLLPIGKLKLSFAFLLPDSENPWIVLVPEANDIKEWHHLNNEQQLELNNEINLISNFMEKKFNPDKINIGALGNIVPQLHIHIITRYKNDRAWPEAIWGSPAGKNQVIISSWKNTFQEILS